MKKHLRIILGVCIGLISLAYYVSSQTEIEGTIEKIHFSDLVQNVDDGKVNYVRLVDKHVYGRFTDGVYFKSYIPEQDTSLIDKLLANKVRVIAQAPTSLFPFIRDIVLPLLLISSLIYASRLPLRNRKNSYNKKDQNTQTITFDDVGGLLEAKEELEEMVDFLKNPKKYQQLGAKIPKGILLVGEPGNGKTYLAKAVAGQAHVPFFYMSGSSFVEMFVGLGASRVRDLFQKAAAQAPALIFIDEIDAIGTARGSGIDAGSRESEKTLNELLVAMDGFGTNANVVVIAATNRDDVLDPALLRRFERKIYVQHPDLQERKQILKIYAKDTKLAENVNLDKIAQLTIGSSAADLKMIFNEAKLLAARFNQNQVTQHNLEQALDRIALGLEKKHTIMSQEEKELTAYHESGHAIANFILEGKDAIHKITIVPRGHALGMVASLPKENIHMTLNHLNNKLIIAAAGRAAELWKYGADKITTGASSDIKYATSLAWSMCTQWGLSDLGAINYNMDGNRAFTTSDQTKEQIAQQVKNKLAWAQNEATKIIKEHEDKFELLAKTVLKKETLSGAEVFELFETGSIKEPTEDTHAEKENIESECESSTK